MKYDVILYHPKGDSSYQVIGVGLSHEDAVQLMLSDVGSFASKPVLSRSWGEDIYGVVLYALDYSQHLWCYLLKEHGKPLPPLGFWRGL